METKTIVVEVESNLGSLKSQLREAQAEVAAMSEKFGATSTEAMNAAKAAGRLKDTIGDAKQLTDSFNPDAKFKALTASMSGALNGFQAVQGAMGLFGAEGVEVQKMLLQVQSAMALAQGVDGLLEAKDAFKTFGAQVGNNLKSIADGAKNAFSTVKGAIAATGIGLLVIALGYVVSNFDEISAKAKTAATSTNNWLNSSSTTAKATKKYLELLLLPITLMIDLYHEVEDAILGTSDATRAVALQQQRVADARNRQLEEEKNAQIAVVKGLDRKIALLDSEGKSTIALRKEKLALQLQEAEMNLQALEFVSQAMSGSDVMKSLYVELINNAKDTVNKLKIEENNITSDQKAENQKRIDDAKSKAEEKAANEKTASDAKKQQEKEDADASIAENQRIYDEWLKLNAERITKKDSQFSLEQELTNTAKEQELAKLIESYEAKYLIAANNGRLEYLLAEQQKIDIDALNTKYNDKAAADDAAAKEKQKTADQAETQRKLQNFNKIMDLTKDSLQGISDIVAAFAGKSKAAQKKAFATQKKLNIAIATVETIKGAVSAFTGMTSSIPGPVGIALGVVAAAGVAASGVAQVKKITSTKFDGGGDEGGGGGGGGDLSSSAPAAPTPANFNVVGNSGTNQLMQGLQNQPIKAYVVGGDVTTAQNLDRNKITTASI